jgi:hypothetical protein
MNAKRMEVRILTFKAFLRSYYDILHTAIEAQEYRHAYYLVESFPDLFHDLFIRKLIQKTSDSFFALDIAFKGSEKELGMLLDEEFTESFRFRGELHNYKTI